jgi:hypothetical protein
MQEKCQQDRHRQSGFKKESALRFFELVSPSQCLPRPLAPLCDCIFVNFGFNRRKLKYNLQEVRDLGKPLANMTMQLQRKQRKSSDARDTSRGR